jgi:hypothetical protein
MVIIWPQLYNVPPSQAVLPVELGVIGGGMWTLEIRLQPDFIVTQAAAYDLLYATAMQVYAGTEFSHTSTEAKHGRNEKLKSS